MKLLIVMPVLNEEESIAPMIEHCLAARERIISDSPVTEVEVTVVSDGSTDRTPEIASRYVPRIKLIAFEKNAATEPRSRRPGHNRKPNCWAFWMQTALAIRSSLRPCAER